MAPAVSVPLAWRCSAWDDGLISPLSPPQTTVTATAGNPASDPDASGTASPVSAAAAPAAAAAPGPEPGLSAVPDPSPELLQRASLLRRSALALGQLNDGPRRQAVEAMATALEAAADTILAANRADLEAAAREDLAAALVARLKLDPPKLAAAIAGVRQVAALPDPLGRRQLHTELDQGLVLERISVPLGVLGVIFEARPDAVMQIGSLAIRSGNGALLKGGREARRSCEAILVALRRGLQNSAVDPGCLELLTSRQESLALLRLDGLVDLIIPRGSNALVRFIQDHTRIPVLGHADGICHLYVDRAADPDQALRIALDSKTQYPAACNAIETLLVHRDIAARFLPQAIAAFTAAGVELRGDAAACGFGVARPATEQDWGWEYSDLILSVRVVDDLEMALEHIRRYGSRHTDAICTTDAATAERFLAAVDSAGVYHNCSTRFADGFRYGFGAEVGISTQTLPPRGPVGLEGLVTYRYRLRGAGHIAADYVSGERSFRHHPLPLEQP
jgi:glutamate-5-semialdehyde dehydrogenase